MKEVFRSIREQYDDACMLWSFLPRPYKIIAGLLLVGVTSTPYMVRDTKESLERNLIYTTYSISTNEITKTIR